MGVDRPFLRRQRSLSSVASAGLFLFPAAFSAKGSLAVRVGKSFFGAIAISRSIRVSKT